MPLLKTFGKKPSKAIDMDDLENLNDEDDEPEPEPEPIIADTKNSFSIVAVIYMSRGLVSAESSGTSDPFVRIKYDNQTIESTTKNNTMNGIWNEKYEFKNIRMKLDDITTWPIFQVSVLFEQGDAGIPAQRRTLPMRSSCQFHCFLSSNAHPVRNCCSRISGETARTYLSADRAGS